MILKFIEFIIWTLLNVISLRFIKGLESPNRFEPRRYNWLFLLNFIVFLAVSFMIVFGERTLIFEGD